jgi:DNA-directed RNA polymerase specialized sigma24 family protein
MHADAPPPHDAQIDWAQARRFLRDRLAREVDAKEEAHLDDLVQEACVRLLRAVRREPVAQLEGLMATIARRTWADHVRRRILARRWFEWSDARAAQTPDPRPLHDPLLGDLLARVELVVLESFHRQGRFECEQLTLAHFAGQEWSGFAADHGLTDVAVRKRWSRCLEMLRGEIERDPQLRALGLWS